MLAIRVAEIRERVIKSEGAEMRKNYMRLYPKMSKEEMDKRICCILYKKYGFRRGEFNE